MGRRSPNSRATTIRSSCAPRVEAAYWRALSSGSWATCRSAARARWREPAGSMSFNRRRYETPYTRHPPAGNRTETYLIDACSARSRTPASDANAVDGFGVSSVLSPARPAQSTWPGGSGCAALADGGPPVVVPADPQHAPARAARPSRPANAEDDRGSAPADRIDRAEFRTPRRQLQPRHARISTAAAVGSGGPNSTLSPSSPSATRAPTVLNGRTTRACRLRAGGAWAARNPDRRLPCAAEPLTSTCGADS